MHLKTLIWVLLAITSGPSDAKVYEVSVREMYMTSDSKPGFIDLGTLRVSRQKRTSYVVTGTMIMGYNIGNSVLVDFEIFKKLATEEKYTEKVLDMAKTHFCDMLRDEDLYPMIIEASNLPPQDECPFPKGNYTIKDFELKEEVLPDKLPVGDYKVDLNFFEDDKRIATIVFITNVK